MENLQGFKAPVMKISKSKLGLNQILRVDCAAALYLSELPNLASFFFTVVTTLIRICIPIHLKQPYLRFIKFTAPESKTRLLSDLQMKNLVKEA